MVYQGGQQPPQNMIPQTHQGNPMSVIPPQPHSQPSNYIHGGQGPNTYMPPPIHLNQGGGQNKNIYPHAPQPNLQQHSGAPINPGIIMHPPNMQNPSLPPPPQQLQQQHLNQPHYIHNSGINLSQPQPQPVSNTNIAPPTVPQIGSNLLNEMSEIEKSQLHNLIKEIQFL